MIKKLALSLMVLTTSMFVFACSSTSKQRTATANIGEAKVSMTLKPMLGIHSDWHRTLKITTSEDELEIKLFGDTGWWRGSSLYLHKSGDLALFEGQNGWMRFQLSPLKSTSAKRFYKLERAMPPELKSELTDAVPKSKYSTR